MKSTNQLLTDKFDGAIVGALINDNVESHASVDVLINDYVVSPASPREMSPSSQHAGSDAFHEPFVSAEVSPENGVANTDLFYITFTIELANELRYNPGTKKARRSNHYEGFNRQIVSWLAAKLVFQTATDEYTTEGPDELARPYFTNHTSSPRHQWAKIVEQSHHTQRMKDTTCNTRNMSKR